MTHDQIEKIEALLKEAAEIANDSDGQHGKLCASSIYTLLGALYDPKGMEELAQSNFLHSVRSIERISRENNCISQGQN